MENEHTGSFNKYCYLTLMFKQVAFIQNESQAKIFNVLKIKFFVLATKKVVRGRLNFFYKKNPILKKEFRKSFCSPDLFLIKPVCKLSNSRKNFTKNLKTVVIVGGFFSPRGYADENLGKKTI